MFLNCHTGFSFKYGTLPVQQLFDEAKKYGVKKLVLTEINNTASFIEMLRICNKMRPDENGLNKFGKEAFELQIAVGIEFRNVHELLYIAIAKNNQGFEKINRFLSRHNRDDQKFPVRPQAQDDVIIIYPLGKIHPEQLRKNEFIGVRKHELLQFTHLGYYEEFSNKFVILHPVTFLKPVTLADGKVDKRDYNAHRLLRAIHDNTLLSKLPPDHQAREDEFMIAETELEKAFVNFPKIIENTKEIIKECTIDFKLGEDKNRKHINGSLEEDLNILEIETWKGFKTRYKNLDDEKEKEIKDRIRKELSIIKQKNFAAYYLISWSIIQYAISRGFDFVGRGSGANSTVAYCLGITNVDPIELNLYFERFLNEERVTPPDFDIDFSWDNRDEIYDYIFKTYGQEHVCLLGTHVTYQGRSILRELGKVFGLPKEEINDLVEAPDKLKDRDEITRLVYNYAQYIINKELPSNFSIHAGGVLITQEPIYTYTAIDLPPKGYPISHFEMHQAEDFGIYKFDILSQRGLGHIKEAIHHIKRNQGVDIDINQFEEFKKDEKVKDLLRNSKAMGCFYVESPAMRMLLTKLKCNDYLTLVAASSIIRPGVASSGMMRAYIERFHMVKRGEKYEAIHPRMDDLMKETFGVMVYQEDVIKVAHEFAGITLTEADVLRRGMSGKYRSREEFQRVKDRFFEECYKRKYEQKVIDRVWFEIESFSGYSFAKGHSASYAVESYQSLFLKAHYPLEFMVGVINNFGGFYKTEFYFHEARMNGANIQPPCVNNSNHLTTIKGTIIYIGFIHIKNLEKNIAQQISIEREANGAFINLEDFLRRLSIGMEQVRILIRIGAFRFTGKSKQHLLWEAMLHFNNVKTRSKASVLFDTAPKEYPLPQLQRNELEDAFDEIELLGFPLGDPFKLLKTTDHGNVVAKELLNKIGEHVQIVGYVVTTKDAWTKQKDTMHFGTFLDKEGNVFDTVHFPDSAKKFPFRGRGFYRMDGKVTEDFGVATIEVSMMEKLPMIHKRAEESMREPTVNLFKPQTNI